MVQQAESFVLVIHMYVLSVFTNESSRLFLDLAVKSLWQIGKNTMPWSCADDGSFQ